ncbi:MAG: hypothetical protein WDN06_08120 [Asticcacaulis sp.]
MSNQEPINTFSSRVVVLTEANIDTDQDHPGPLPDHHHQGRPRQGGVQ